MVLIRFPTADAKRKALGYLAGRYSFTSWRTGEVLVPSAALGALALEGIPFQSEGPASYEQAVPALRDAAAVTVQ